MEKIDACQSGSWDVNVSQCEMSWDVSVSGALDVHDFYALPIKRPYYINKAHVEFVEGAWNQEKTQYGIRIGFASGAVRCFWGDTGRKVLECILNGIGCTDEILNKYDERVKAGPPRM